MAPSCFPRRWWGLIPAIAGLGGLAASPAPAVDLTWNGGSGLASDPAQWSPAQVPQPGDQLRFLAAAPYTVSFDASVPASLGMIVRGRAVTHEFLSPHTISTDLVVAAEADTAGLRVTEGTLVVKNRIGLGSAGVARFGRMRVTGDGVVLGDSVAATATLRVGLSEYGVLQIQDGGTLFWVSGARLGSTGGTTGELRIEGHSGAAMRASSLTGPTPGSDLVVDGGRVDVVDGGRLDWAGGLLLATSGGVADLSVGGISAVDSARTTLGRLEVGWNATGAPAGAASATVEAGGVLTVQGVTRVGDADGGTATLALRAGGLFETAGLVTYSPDALDVTGGTLRIRGGELVTAERGITWPGGPDHPVLEFRDAAFVHLNDPGEGLMIAGSGDATVVLSDESRLEIRTEEWTGIGEGGAGHLILRTGSTFDSDWVTTIWHSGGGEIVAESGARISTGYLFLGGLPPGPRRPPARGAWSDSCTVVIDGAGTDLDVAVSLQIDIFSSVTVSNSATASVGSGGDAVFVYPGGSLVVDHASVAVTGALDAAGTIRLDAGTLDTSWITLYGLASLEGSGTVNGVVYTEPDSDIRVEGDLSLGSGAASEAVTIDGKLWAVDHVVSLASSDSVLVGGVVLLRGEVRLTEPASALVVKPGGVLVGDGLVSGRVFLGGTVATLDGAAGRLETTGSFTFRPGSIYVAKAYDTAGASDTLHVGGVAELDGTLAISTPLDFQAAAGDSFRIVISNGLVGEFAQVTWNEEPVDGYASVHYAPDGAWVVLNAPVGAPVPLLSAPELRFAALGSPGRNAAFELVLPEAGDVRIRVFDVTGRRIATLQEGRLAAGRHRFPFAEGRAAAGVVFARAEITTAHGAEARVAKAVVRR